MRPTYVSLVERVMLVSEASRDAERISAGVAQFDDQVTAIVGFVELALRGAGDDAALRADLEEIRAAAVRAVVRSSELAASARVVERASLQLAE